PTAEVYDRRAQEVSSLQYFSKLITQVLDFDDLADTVTDICTRVSSAEAAWIILGSRDDSKTIAVKNAAYVDSEIINNYLFNNKKIYIQSNIIFYTIEDYKYKRNLSQLNVNILVSPFITYNSLTGFIIAVRKNVLIIYEED